MGFAAAMGVNASPNRGEVRCARVGGGAALVSQDGAVIRCACIYHETFEAPLGAPAFVACAPNACTPGFMGDALCCPEDQMAATEWARTSGGDELSGRLRDSGCYSTTPPLMRRRQGVQLTLLVQLTASGVTPMSLALYRCRRRHNRLALSLGPIAGSMLGQLQQGVHPLFSENGSGACARVVGKVGWSVHAGATVDRFAAQASTPGGPGLHSRRQGDMPQRQSAWTQPAQLAIGAMAALATGTKTTASPLTPGHSQRDHSCLTTKPRPARDSATNVTMPPTQISSWKNQKGV